MPRAVHRVVRIGSRDRSRCVGLRHIHIHTCIHHRNFSLLTSTCGDSRHGLQRDPVSRRRFSSREFAFADVHVVRNAGDGGSPNSGGTESPRGPSTSADSGCPSDSVRGSTFVRRRSLASHSASHSGRYCRRAGRSRRRAAFWNIELWTSKRTIVWCACGTDVFHRGDSRRVMRW